MYSNFAVSYFLLFILICCIQYNEILADTSQDDTSFSEEVEIFSKDNVHSQESGRLLTSLAIGEGSRRQSIVPSNKSFPCLVDTSPVNESTSVHKLRPSDIKVVATIGDSLVTGFGALAESIVDLYKLDQGVSWTIGGDGSWRSAVTIPNLLRQFNPKLVGYAMSNNNSVRHFGMGEPQSHDEHLLRQAKRLVATMRADPRVDIKKDWKLVTVLSGQNDICSGDPCFPSDDAATREHTANLRRALDFLHANLPRTYVSLLPVLDVTAGWRIEKSLFCGMMTMIECRCLYASGDKEDLGRMKKIVAAFHRAERELVNNGIYDTTDDFTVELQPFTSKLEPPRARNFLGFELADLSLFSVDCFHLSQKGHAAFATMQWNNLLQPEGKKSTQFLRPMQELLCPTSNAPYLFTRRNSRTFKSTGHQ